MTLDTAVPTIAPRRADLDAVRVGAFLLLILYHVGMAFVTWDWHVKTSHPSDALEPFMVLLNPWRLSLLFFVSGCATRFMLDRVSPRRLTRLRLARLGIPLLFGMLVVVPPQSWVQVREHGYQLGYWAFYGRYLMADHHFCDAGGCLILPTWNHLWFVAYLLVYTLPLGWALMAWPRMGARLAWLGRWFAGFGAVAVPVAWLVGVRLVAGGDFEVTHALWGDWVGHAEFLPVFLLGFGVAWNGAFWEYLVRHRRALLAVAVCTTVAWSVYVGSYPGDLVPPDWQRWVMRVVYGVDQWVCIAAVLGYAKRYIHRRGRVLEYLTLGVFPFYIAHQTIIVVTEYYLKRLDWPQWVEGLVLISVTVAGCLAVYEVARRVAWLRPLFGLSNKGFSWRVVPASLVTAEGRPA